MGGSTRTTILVSVAVVLLLLVGVWWYFGFSLEFTKFFAAEPTSTCPPGTIQIGITNSFPPQLLCVTPTPTGSAVISPTPETPPNVSAGMVSCSPSTQTVGVNVTAALSADGGTGVYTWNAPEGVSVSAQGAAKFQVKYSGPGMKKVLLSGPRVSSTAIDVVACTVIVN